MLLTACAAKAPPQRPPPTVGVVTLRPLAVTLTSELPGRTAPFEIADVRPQVGGIILARTFKEGAVVTAGQLLYQIDPAPYRAAYDQAKAQLAAAEANLTTTHLKADRFADLVKIHAVSGQDNDDAQAAFKQAQAAVAQDAAASEAARINLAYTRVTAPIGGRIGISSVTKGALVTASQANALDTIQRLDPIYVDVTQSAAQLLALRAQMARGGLSTIGPGSAQVRLTLEDGSAYPLAGEMQFTDITVDQTTGAVTLRAVFPNPQGVLLPGMYARATVVEGIDTNALLAPEQGVGRDQKGNPTALVVDRHGVVQYRQIQTGQTVGNKWLVTAGLSPGDQLIVQGLQSASPGQHVRTVPAAGLP